MQICPEYSLPIVQAVLKCGNVGWIWVVPQCPYCGDEHWHSGGPLTADPYRFVGPDSAQACICADLAREQVDSASVDAQSMSYILQPDSMVSM